MVFAEALTEYLIAGLSERISETESHPFPDTLHADRYLAMSALQKAIRRGNEPVAHRAALNLLRGNARERVGAIVMPVDDKPEGEVVAISNERAK